MGASGRLLYDFSSLVRWLWGFAGCHSLSRENLYFHVLEVPGGHLFEHCFRCGFQCVFWPGFIRFALILGGTLTPFGLPWAAHLLPQGHLCQDRCKGRLQGPKRVTFRSILSAIWEDFGWHFGRFRLHIEYSFLRYSFVIYYVLFWYSSRIL